MSRSYTSSPPSAFVACSGTALAFECHSDRSFSKIFDFPVNIIPPRLSLLISSGGWTTEQLVASVQKKIVSLYRREQQHILLG
jgi:hypothetical protein